MLTSAMCNLHAWHGSARWGRPHPASFLDVMKTHMVLRQHFHFIDSVLSHYCRLRLAQVRERLFGFRVPCFACFGFCFSQACRRSKASCRSQNQPPGAEALPICRQAHWPGQSTKNLPLMRRGRRRTVCWRRLVLGGHLNVSFR